MTKEERAEISRRNGAKSKGPKTEEGRRSIADANTTHGLYRNVVTVLDIESQEAFHKLRDAAFEHWTPRNLMESQFVEELVDYSWRINRLRLSATVETNAAVTRVRQSITGTIRSTAALAMAEVESSTPQGALQMIQRRINALIANRAAVTRELRAMKATPLLEITQSMLTINDLSLHETRQSHPPTQPEPTAEPS